MVGSPHKIQFFCHLRFTLSTQNNSENGPKNLGIYQLILYSWSSKSVLFLSDESKGEKKVEDTIRGHDEVIRSVKLKIES